MNTIVKSTLRPGLLVSLRTQLTGNVRYAKRTIEGEHITDDGAQKARWETERTVSDPVEHENGIKARSKARSVIAGVCSFSAFGLLCPESEADELDSAVAVARRIADDFNASASLTRLTVHVMTGRIAPDDVEAVKAINSEVRELMAEMEIGIERIDVKMIREAAGRAQALGAMLSTDAAAKVQIAVDAARKAARKLVKAGDQAATEIDRGALRKLEEMRTSFLDLDGTTGDMEVPVESGRAFDLDTRSPEEQEQAIRDAEENIAQLDAARAIEVE